MPKWERHLVCQVNQFIDSFQSNFLATHCKIGTMWRLFTKTQRQVTGFVQSRNWSKLFHGQQAVPNYGLGRHWSALMIPQYRALCSHAAIMDVGSAGLRPLRPEDVQPRTWSRSTAQQRFLLVSATMPRSQRRHQHTLTQPDPSWVGLLAALLIMGPIVYGVVGILLYLSLVGLVLAIYLVLVVFLFIFCLVMEAKNAMFRKPAGLNPK